MRGSNTRKGVSRLWNTTQSMKGLGKIARYQQRNLAQKELSSLNPSMLILYLAQ